MDVQNEPIPAEQFAICQRHLPETCVEVFLEHDGAVLLARRTNRPAQGEWFTPGTRLYKGEELPAAAHRVAAEELGIEIDLRGQLGVHSHFWETSAIQGVESRHTVNIVYRASPARSGFEITLDEQHDAYRFVSEPELECHEYMRRYLRQAGYESE
jgi:colanic acid biosynthesis protein WcaH